MSRKTLVAIALLVAISSQLLVPKRVHAITTEEGFIIGGSALAAYILVIVVGTKLAYPKRPHLLVPSADAGDAARAKRDSGLRFGPHCPPVSSGVSLACW